MSKATVLASLLVIGYLVFEAYAITRAGYRTEPLYILDRYVSANHATARCGDPPAAQREKFMRNLAVVRRDAAGDLAEAHPQAGAGQVAAMLDERVAAVEREIDELVAELGCDASEVRSLLLLHRARARLKLR